MSWSLSLSGHVEGDDAAAKEAAILAAAQDIASSNGGSGSFYGNTTGSVTLPMADAQSETIGGVDPTPAATDEAPQA